MSKENQLTTSKGKCYKREPCAASSTAVSLLYGGQVPTNQITATSLGASEHELLLEIHG